VPRAQTSAARTRDEPATIEVLIGALESRHPRVRAHCQAVASLAVRIARQLPAGEQGEETVRLAGPIHDIGKLAVPTAILDKPGPLSSSEWKLVRRHPGEGERLLRPLLPEGGEVLAAVRWHHERWDGGGYPDGLVGTETPLAARIIAVADAFHAMLETRPYRPGRPALRALEELDEHAGSQFDPDCVSALRLALHV
jgi:two-component system, cell cycle response regulator